MKTSVITMVMTVLVSMNINAKTNNDSWRNANKNNKTVVVVTNTRNHGAIDHKMDMRKFDKHHDKMHRHHECVLVKDGKKTYVCKVCGTHYKESKHRK